MGAFSAFKDKRAARKKQETPTVSDHYLKLARRSALIRYICIIFVVTFAVYSLSFHASEISMENFRYMLKFINIDEEETTAVGTKLDFDGSVGNRGIIFMGDLAIVNENGLTIIGWDGETILHETFSSDHPKIDENGINLFCYDLGGKELRIFRSYSRISTISFDYPIYSLATSKDGGFAVATSAKGYRGAVYVYDKEFRNISTQYLGDKYADFVDISDDGKEYLTASHYSSGGKLVTQITKIRVDSDAKLFEESFEGEVPLGIYYTSDGFCLMTSDRVRIFDSENNIQGEIAFGDKKLMSGKVMGDNLLLCYGIEGLSGGTETVIYNRNEVMFEHSFPTALSDSAIIGNYFYALAPGVLYTFNLENGEEAAYSIPTSYSALVDGDDKLILFSENQAEIFNPQSFQIKEDN